MTNTLQPLQRLVFAVPPAGPRDLGEKGEQDFLPLAHLFVDPAYQRDILDRGKANIRRMIEEFSWQRFGACVVARRGKNRYAIIDGQHRATAAFNLGVAEVPCLILKGDQEAEARAFNAINANITRIQPLQTFRAAVTGGDKDAIALVEACAEAGVTIATHSNIEHYRPGETQAFGTMQKCMKRDGRKVLVTALIILRAADPEAPLAAVAVNAACQLAPKHPEWAKDAAKVGGYIARSGKRLAALILEAQKRKMLRGGTSVNNLAALLEQAIASGQRAADPRTARMMAGR